MPFFSLFDENLMKIMIYTDTEHNSIHLIVLKPAMASQGVLRQTFSCAIVDTRVILVVHASEILDA